MSIIDLPIAPALPIVSVTAEIHGLRVQPHSPGITRDDLAYAIRAALANSRAAKRIHATAVESDDGSWLISSADDLSNADLWRHLADGRGSVQSDLIRGISISSFLDRDRDVRCRVQGYLPTGSSPVAA